MTQNSRDVATKPHRAVPPSYALSHVDIVASGLTRVVRSRLLHVGKFRISDSYKNECSGDITGCSLR